jgi:DNA-binding SARP family transcriptional activator/tetratricopeptide (TPR) repeat protein
MKGALADEHLVMVADPGFGKTWALEDALAELGAGVAWVRCVPADREPARLVQDVVAAVLGAHPELAGEPPATLQALLDQLRRILVEPLVVAFDDAERLADAPAALAVVDQLLRSDVQRLRVALLSRVDLPLRLAKLRAAGSLSEVRRGELAFSASECREVMALRRGSDPEPDELEAMMESTEGWPLGVALQSLASTRARGRASTAVGAFLVEEVLEQLEPDMARGLLVASLSRELDAATAAALELPPGFADTAERRGLLVRALDPERTRFALHPLFREVLTGLLARSLPAERIAELRLALARVLLERDPAEAIDQLVAAQAWEELLAALGQHGPALARTSPELVTRWVGALPEDLREEPEALLMRGAIEWGLGHRGAAIRWLRGARDEFERRGDVERRWLAAMLLGEPLYAGGEFDELVAQVEGFDAAGGVLAMGAAHHAAVVLAGLGRRSESDTLAARIFEQPGSDALRLYEPIRFAYAEIPGGAVDTVLAAAQAVVARFEDHDPMNIGTLNIAGIAQIQQEVGRDGDARRWWRAAIDRAESNGLMPYVVTFAHLHIALMRALDGRLPEAEAELALAGPVDDVGWRGHIVPAVRAVLAARRGDRHAAVAEAREADETVAKGPINERVWSAEALVEALVDVGEHERALAIADATLALCDERLPGATGSFYRARLLLVRAYAGRAPADLAEVWAEGGKAIDHVVRRHRRIVERLLPEAIEAGVVLPREAIDAVDRALPGGQALIAFLDSSDAATRAAAIGPAAASGHPVALARVRDLASDPDPAVRAAAEATAERLAQSPPALSFRVFGRFGVRRGQWEIGDGDWERPMVARVVRFLLVNRERSVPEDELFEAFWPDREAAAARRSLQVTVSAARAVLDVPGAPSVLETGSRMYRLRLPASARIDADEFERLARAALAEPPGPRRRTALERADAAWAGEPLPEERYAAWAVVYRERLLDLRRELLRALIAAAERADDSAAAIHAARDLARLDPLDEGARRELIAAYARAGRRADALREFMELRRALVDELGLEPDAETAALHARVLAGEPV